MRQNPHLTRDRCKQIHQRQRIVQIVQSILKSGILLPHQMMQRQLGCQIPSFSLRLLLLVPSGTSTNLLHKRFKLVKLLYYRFVYQDFHILHVIKRLTLFIPRCASVGGFAGVYALEDAKTTKVLQRYLEIFEALRVPNEGGVKTGVVGLLFFYHAGKFAFGVPSRMFECLFGFWSWVLVSLSL